MAWPIAAPSVGGMPDAVDPWVAGLQDTTRQTTGSFLTVRSRPIETYTVRFLEWHCNPQAKY